MAQTTIKKIEAQPKEIKPIFLEAVLMPQGEIICKGKTIGWFEEFFEYIYIIED